MLIASTQPITAESLEHLPGFVATQVRRVAQTHGKTTWEYHHEHLPPQDFSPWLFLDGLFWLYLRGSAWWLDYGGTQTSMVAAQEGRSTDDTDIWLLTDMYGEVQGEVSVFRTRLSPPTSKESPSFSRMGDHDARPIDRDKLTVWRITFSFDEYRQPAVLPRSAPQTDPVLRAVEVSPIRP